MTVTLNELLMLAGRLDDSSGFETPRERFRRFLLEHVTDAHTARTLIEQCQHAPGDQHHRALQDLVVVLGRCLGFDIRFGSYLPAAGTHKADGHWRSRRLDVVLEVRTGETQTTGSEALARSLEALTTPAHPVRAGRALGLCVLTPLYAGRGGFQELQASDALDSRVRFATLGSLLSAAEMIGSRRLTHDELVRLLGSGLQLDFLVELLHRAAGAAAPAEPSVSDAGSGTQAGTSFWLATIGADQGATPEQLVEIVIGRRRVLGVEDGTRGSAQPGDRLCLHVPGKGVVGHCRVASTPNGAGGIRDAHRFGQVLHVEDVTLYVSTPVALDGELQLRMRAARAGHDGAAPSLMRISRQEFERLAAGRDADARRSGDSTRASLPGGADRRAEVPVSVEDSRSHA